LLYRCNGFAGLRSLICIDGGKFPINVGELAFEFVLLIEDLLAPVVEPFTVLLHQIGEPYIGHLKPPR
jgi:hypothetical protein